MLNLDSSRYEQLTDRSVRVWGSRFEPSEKYQVKLEGAATCGYRTVCIGGVRDPILIRQIERLLPMVKAYVANLYPELKNGEAQVYFHIYGKNAVMEDWEPAMDDIPHEIGVLIEVVAQTQELASAICSNVRVALLHGPYPGQLATGGNLALPLNPPDNPLGPVCRFSVYHLMAIDDPVALFPIVAEEV